MHEVSLPCCLAYRSLAWSWPVCWSLVQRGHWLAIKAKIARRMGHQTIAGSHGQKVVGVLLLMWMVSGTVVNKWAVICTQQKLTLVAKRNKNNLTGISTCSNQCFQIENQNFQLTNLCKWELVGFISSYSNRGQLLTKLHARWKWEVCDVTSVIINHIFPWTLHSTQRIKFIWFPLKVKTASKFSNFSLSFY